MGRVNWVCALLCLLLLFSTFSESCLDGTTERLISGSRYSVQDWFFKANSVIGSGSYTPREARLGGDSWCSSDSLTVSSERPWLQVTFTKEFNISIIQTGGYDGYDDYYLTRFQVHVGNGTQGSLRPLTMPDDSTRPIVFRRWGRYDTENTVLPSPVIARVLRIVAVRWTPSNQVCLRLEALGCLPSPVPTTTTEPKTEVSTSTMHETSSTKETSATIQETSPTEATSYTMQETSPTEDVSEASSMPQPTPTEEISETSSNTMQETTPTEEISEASSSTTQKTIFETPRGQSRIVVVAGSVGGVLCLLVVLLLPVILVVVAIVNFRRKNAQFQRSQSHEDHSEYKFDNSIYGMEIVVPSLCNDARDHRFDNCIYGEEPALSNLYEDVTKCTSKGEFNTDCCQCKPDIDSSITSNLYCSIPTNTTIFHESMQDPNGILDQHNEKKNISCLCDKKCREPFEMENHADRENIPAGLPTNTITSTTTTKSYEPVTDLNDTLPYHQQMRDNPLYGECNN